MWHCKIEGVWLNISEKSCYWLFCFENSLSNIGTYCVTRPTSADKKPFYSKHVLFWFLQQRPAHFLHQIVLLAAALSWSWSCKIDQRFGKMSVLGMFQYKCKVGNWTATMDRVDTFNCSIHPLCCGKSRQSSKSWKKLPIYKC